MARRIAILALGLVIFPAALWLAVHTAAIGVRHLRPAPADAAVNAPLLQHYLATSDRVRKAQLIQHLRRPPKLVIFGGSRALRFDPASIQRRTGLSGFNAAVSGARPEDAWALLNLLHTRFPRARFRFLWVIHADEFDQKPLDYALLADPLLSRYFPPHLLAAQRVAAGNLVLDPANSGRVLAPDGHVIHDSYDRRFPHPGQDAGAVAQNIRKELALYAGSPDKLGPRLVRYFRKTLRLMDHLAAAPPVIVAAPVDPRVFAATVHMGWGARHLLVLRFLHQLSTSYSFRFLDLSKASSCGCTPADFYDGIHLTPSGTTKVVNAVLRRFPRAFARTTVAARGTAG